MPFILSDPCWTRAQIRKLQLTASLISLKIFHTLTSREGKAINTTALPRLVVLVGLLIAQVLVVSFSVDAIALAGTDAVWFSPLAYSAVLVKLLAVAVVLIGIGLGPRMATYFDALTATQATTNWLTLLVQLFMFGCFFALSTSLFTPDQAASNSSDWLPIIWLVIGCATGVTWFLTVAPRSFWQKFLRAEWPVVLMSLLVGLPIVVLSMSANLLWAPLGEATFNICVFLLALIYENIYIEPAEFIIGTENFLVAVGHQCSGYEGIALVVAFIVIYLSAFRAEFRFPQALILLPVGALVIWILNAFRITLLIIVGEEFSPEIAVGGFHSQAGWIFFVLVSTLLLFAFNSWSYIRRSKTADSRPMVNPTTALLIPLIILLTATLLTNAFSAEFNWFYPLRVLATATALYFMWRFYDWSSDFSYLVPYLAGAGVFAVWLVLVEANPAADTAFTSSLHSVPIIYAAIWLVFRFIGSVITVPIAEELAFRGYLMAKLDGKPATTSTPLKFSWFAWITSSIAFGALHDAWLAGILAGLVYGYVRYLRNRIWDAIIAHSTTNFLLFLYAAYTSYWSLW